MRHITPYFILLLLFSASILPLISQNTGAGEDSGVFLRIQPKDQYIEGEAITIQFFASGLDAGKVIQSSISVTLTIQGEETKTVQSWPGEKQTIAFKTLKRGIYKCNASASVGNYYKDYAFEILILPPPIEYTAQILPGGENFIFRTRADSNFTITITGYKAGEAVPIKTYIGNGSFDVFLQSVPSLFQPNRERYVQYDMIEINIVDNNGWANYNNQGRSYKYAYVEVEPYSIVMLFSVIGALIMGIILIVVIRKHFSKTDVAEEE